MTEFRFESDTMGEVRVPFNVHYGAQTQRAADNFNISGIRFPRRFIKMLAGTAVPGVRVADNLFESISSRDAVVEASATLKDPGCKLNQNCGRHSTAVVRAANGHRRDLDP